MLLILALSALVVDRSRQLGERETTARVMLAALLPAMLVIAQPDLGSGLVYLTIAVTLLFVAGVPWRHLAGLLALGAAAIALVLVVAPAAGVQVLKPYEVERLTSFLHPSSNPQKEGYQQLESKIAIGAGQTHGQRRQQHPDPGRIRARGQHRLHLRGGRRALRLRRRGARALAVRAADLAHAADPDAGEGSVRCAGCRGRGGYAYVSGVRQRGRGCRHHARHRRDAAAHELWRLVGDRDAAGRGPAAVDLRSGARHRGFEGPRAAAYRGWRSRPQAGKPGPSNIKQSAGTDSAHREPHITAYGPPAPGSRPPGLGHNRYRKTDLH